MIGGEEFVCHSAGEKGAEPLKDRVSKTLLKGAESQSTGFKWFNLFFKIYFVGFICAHIWQAEEALCLFPV